MERTRKHLLAAALALAAALILAVPALAADGYTEVDTAEELFSALNNKAEAVRLTGNIQVSQSINIDGALELDLNNYTLTVLGSASIIIDENLSDQANVTIKNGTITANNDDKNCLWQSGGKLLLSDLTVNGSIFVNNAETIEDCEITLDLGNKDGNGIAPLIVAENSRVGNIMNSTIIGKGQAVWGITIKDWATIGNIENCTITSNNEEFEGPEGAYSILNGGTIGTVNVKPGNVITGLVGSAYGYGNIDDGYGEVTGGIYVSGGEIGMLSTIEIAGIRMLGGEIKTIERSVISPFENSTSLLDTISLENSATIGTIANNTITAEGNGYGIYNKGTISDLGENTFISGNQSTDVLNDGGDLTITAEGTLLYGNEFTSSGGSWFAQNTGAGGTITAPNATEEDKALSFTGQIRLLEPWGLRVNVGIPNVAQSEIESVKVTFTQGDRTEMVTAGYNADYSQAKDGIWYSADLTGIQTQCLDDSISFTAVVTLADRTTIKTEETKTVNMVNVLESCAANGAYSREEQNVYKAILNWFTAYQAYLKANGGAI